jgi:hypothetical protein
MFMFENMLTKASLQFALKSDLRGALSLQLDAEASHTANTAE